MRLLPPQRLRQHYYQECEEALRRFFDRELFGPILSAIESATGLEVENAPSPRDERALRAALRTGRIYYEDGNFAGDFDAETSRALSAIGAKFDERTKMFHLSVVRVPDFVKGESAAFRQDAAAVQARLDQIIKNYRVKLEAGQLDLALDAAAASAVDAIEGGFQTAAEALSIAKRIPVVQRRAIEARYVADIRPYVVKDTARYIDDLHALVTESAAAGYRFDHLIEGVQRLYGVSERKARFLARQETSLFMSAYRRERFEGAGVRRYKWSTSHDRRVRPLDNEEQRRKYGDHRVLDGQLFYYETKAPAIFMSSKQPCNPGEDFGCRCADLAVVE